MKRVLGLIAAAGLAVGLQAAPAASQEIPPHPHMLVLGLQLDETGEPVSFRRCVDLAAGRTLPLNAHHAHIHTGKAGQALFERAGHLAVPGAPVTPWSNCAELIDFFFGG
jgi:hypothetical protein